MSAKTCFTLAGIIGFLCFVSGIFCFISSRGVGDMLSIGIGLYIWAKGLFLAAYLIDKGQAVTK